MNVLFVCTGNTCRSAMAEVVLRGMADRYRLPITVDSAGLAVTPGTACSCYACHAVAELGLHLEDHQPKGITSALIAWSDTVICMTAQGRASVIRMYPAAWRKCITLSQSVDDPAGLSLDAYRLCVQSLRVLLLRWIADQHFPGVTWRDTFRPRKQGYTEADG